MDYKIALVHDALINKGGAERVFQVICEMFPNAPIYTSVYFPDKTLKYFKTRKIITTPVQKLVSNEKQFKFIFPLTNYYMQKLEIYDFDIIFSSSTYCGKYINKKKAKHICYMHQPFRLLWYPDYYNTDGLFNINKLLITPFLSYLRKWDMNAVNKIDLIISNCITTKKRVKDCYNRDSFVVHPPVMNFRIKKILTNNHFLIVSRLEPYKKVDLVIKAFNKLKLPLSVVGVGTMTDYLRNIAQDNITFHGQVNDSELIDLYSKAIALVFPQQEDYGLTPLEANASGKPVICYGFGGVETTMVPYNGHNIEKATALFFYHQTVDDLIDAVKKFNKLKFKPESLRLNAKKFDLSNFKRDIYNFILNVKNE